MVGERRGVKATAAEKQSDAFNFQGLGGGKGGRLPLCELLITSSVTWGQPANLSEHSLPAVKVGRWGLSWKVPCYFPGSTASAITAPGSGR